MAIGQAGVATAATRRPAGPTFAIGRTHKDAAAAFADQSSLATASDKEGDSAVAWLNSHRKGTESIEFAERMKNGRLRRARTVYTHVGHFGAPRQHRPRGTGKERIVPAAPSIAFFHSVPLVTWQELSFATTRRHGNAGPTSVTLEYTVGETFAHLDHGGVLIHKALSGSAQGPLRDATLVGGGNGQVYEIFVEKSGDVLATAVNRAVFR